MGEFFNREAISQIIGDNAFIEQKLRKRFEEFVSHLGVDAIELFRLIQNKQQYMEPFPERQRSYNLNQYIDYRLDRGEIETAMHYATASLTDLINHESADTDKYIALDLRKILIIVDRLQTKYNCPDGLMIGEPAELASLGSARDLTTEQAQLNQLVDDLQISSVSLASFYGRNFQNMPNLTPEAFTSYLNESRKKYQQGDWMQAILESNILFFDGLKDAENEGKKAETSELLSLIEMSAKQKLAEVEKKY